MANNTDTTDALGSESTGRLLLRLSLPAIAAQIINMLYNLVDRMYIGHIENIGRDALTGVGVCFPLIMLISAFAALAGMGGAPRASIFLGKGEKDNAERTMGGCCGSLLAVSLVLTVLFGVFNRPLLLLFGASAETVGYGVQYMNIYCLGTVFVQLTLGMNAFISAQGFSRVSMLTVAIGALCNIILDPIFIFALDMGVAGAALATVISQAVSVVWILRFLTGERTTIRLRARNLLPSPSLMLPCLALGLSPFIMQSTESLIAVCFNSSLLKYGGDVAVCSMTVLTSVMQFSLMPLQGLTQGAQPIISYNLGARKPERIRSTFRLLLICCLSFSLCIWGLAELFPQVFVRIFNDDPELVGFASRALRIYIGGAGIFGIQIACQQTFVSLGNAKCSLFLALLRKIILLIPLIYIIPALMTDKTTAVFLAEPVADILAVLTTSCLFAWQFKKTMCALESEPAKNNV